MLDAAPSLSRVAFGNLFRSVIQELHLSASLFLSFLAGFWHCINYLLWSVWLLCSVLHSGGFLWLPDVWWSSPSHLRLRESLMLLLSLQVWHAFFLMTAVTDMLSHIVLIILVNSVRRQGIEIFWAIECFPEISNEYKISNQTGTVHYVQKSWKNYCLETISIGQLWLVPKNLSCC